MKLLLRIIFLGICGFSFSAQAELSRIISTTGTKEPLPIAITQFGGTGDEVRIGTDISQVIAADLERSGLFRPIDKNAFIESNLTSSSLPKFPAWRQINASGLVVGSVKSLGGGRMEVEFRLWDVFLEQQIAGRSFDTTIDNWRRVSHIIADEVYKRLTGEEGYFDTRIVYVAESGPAKHRIKRLAIMDQDGENHRFLTDGRDLVLTPRFSPAAQQLLYLSYANRKPRVYLYDIATGRERLLGDFPGMSFAPRFAPDGTKALMSVAMNGNTDIYSLDLRSMAKTQLTSDLAIDTSPSYSPNGEQIVFNSDRGGSQQLYIMNSDGSGQKRISFGEGRYGTPVWSPRGDFIAFTKIYKGSFYIGVMRSDGGGERIIAQSYLVEGPSWAPNGRVLIYTKQEAPSAPSRLFSIDVTGYNEREVVTPIEASDPAWSPLLQ